ncbi:G-protein coupled receptor [Fagus crenata]
MCPTQRHLLYGVSHPSLSPRLHCYLLSDCPSHWLFHFLRICNKPGHIALICYNRFNHAYQCEPPQSMQAYIATPSSAGDLNWLFHQISYDKHLQKHLYVSFAVNKVCHIGLLPMLLPNSLGCNLFFASLGVLVELAIPCERPGPRVFEGFIVGFHPRSWEIVYNGMTQLGFEKSHRDFRTEQVHVALYMTAIASISNLVQKPIIKVLPEDGLEVLLSGSGATGKPPTTLSPTVLIVDWRCLKVRDTPYEVNIIIPVEGYEPIQFILTKLRGFIYKTRVELPGKLFSFRVQHGIDALPGMTIVSACLETVSGVGQGYSRAEDRNSAFANEAYWERPPVNAQGAGRPSERKYGSI